MRLLLTGTLLALGLLSAPLIAQEYTIENYQAVFKGDNITQQKQAIESLTLAGLSDPTIYDVLEAKLLASLPNATEKHAIDYSAWLVKGLAYSGEDKYRETMNKIVNGDYNKKLRKYAQQALDNLGKYKKWNTILNDKTQYDASQSQQVNVFASALRSDDLELMRIAAKRITADQAYDTYLLDILSQELKTPRLLTDDQLSIDTYAHMAKALASSGNTEYRAVIENIATTSSNRKLQKYAASYLKKFY